jgi:hypothetical protein
MRAYPLLVIVVLVVAVAAWPQVDSDEPLLPGLSGLVPPGPRTDAEPPVSADRAPGSAPGAATGVLPETAFAPPPAPVLPTGDIITLRTGKVLRNVQVLKTTLTEVHVLTLLAPGSDLEPLIIPRKYVESIVYDDYDPSSAKLAPSRMQQSPELVPGFKVSKELGEKLRAKLEDRWLSFEDRDLVEVLDELGRETGVLIELSSNVRALTPAARQWTLEPTDDLTLSGLLHQKLPESFPDLVVEYQFDKVMVETKAEHRPAQPGPAGAADTGGISNI